MWFFIPSLGFWILLLEVDFFTLTISIYLKIISDFFICPDVYAEDWNSLAFLRALIPCIQFFNLNLTAANEPQIIFK